jgi:phosphoglycolate phosphatase-like HAD superfamily hydrolase
VEEDRLVGGPGAAEAPRTVLFGWDGTLIDSRELILAALREATSALLGYAFPSTAEEFRMLLPMPALEVCQMLSDEPILVRQLEVAYDRAHARLRPAHIGLFPGVAEVLETLQGQGVQVGVVASKERSRVLADAIHCGIDRHIDTFATGEIGVERSPHPRPIDLALADLDTAATDAVLVADGPHSLIAARAAGVRCIGALYGNFPTHEVVSARPGATVTRPLEILDALGLGLGRSAPRLS